MRVTSNMLSTSAVAQFAVSRQKLDEAQRRVSSGHSFDVPSDDPTAALTVMGNDGALRALEQYKRNIGAGTRRLALEENAIDKLNDLMTRAKELAVSQATDTASPSTRQAAKAEVNELLSQAVSLGNTADGSEFLFGGTKSNVMPFTIDKTTSVYTFAASGGTGVRAVEINVGERANTTHDGTQVFGTTASGVLKSLQDLATALETGDRSAVANAIAPLDTAITNNQAIIGEIGARQSQFQIAQANITAFSSNLQVLNSNLHDVDLESAVSEMITRQTAYQAAMSATSRVLSMNLTDYLR